MIARLVEAAIAEGMEPHPRGLARKAWSSTLSLVAVAEGEFLTILPQRSGTRPGDAGILCEKGTNRSPGTRSGTP